MVLTKEERYARSKQYKSTDAFKTHRKEYDRIRLANPEIKARMKAYRQSARGKAVTLKAARKYRATEKYKQYRREYKSSEKYKNYRRNFLYLKNFGITLDAYNELLQKQNNVCAICYQPETFFMRGVLHSLAIDHDHKTGKVRGLLCRACNQMLGLAKDNQDMLSKAIEYLKCHS